MNTRNVNVKTAAQESTERCDLKPFRDVVSEFRVAIKAAGIPACIRICRSGKYYTAIQVYPTTYGINFEPGDSEFIAQMLNDKGFECCGQPVKPAFNKFEATLKS